MSMTTENHQAKAKKPHKKWRIPRWRWLLPILLLLLFLTILVWLPWQARKLEAVERQEQLIADTLWVEQTIQFQLERHEEVLRRLGNEITQDRLYPAQVLDSFSSLIGSNKEIQKIVWLDDYGQVIGARASISLPHNEELRGEFAGQYNEKFRRSLDGKTHCMQPQSDPNRKNSAVINCFIPMVKDKQYYGNLVITYSLQGILEEMVPWWFAQENEISLVDVNEKILADRSAGGLGKNVYSHSRQLELPNLTLNLRTNSIKTEPQLLSNLLVLSIIFLSLGLLWSVVALWRDVNRRIAAEGALRRQVAFSTAMENSLITGLRARDMDGRLTYVNPSFCKMIGREPQELIGRLPPMPYWAPEALHEYQERFTQILSGTVPADGFETIYLRANGERFPVLIYESPLVNEAGKQTGWMSSILDISELKHAQDLTRQQQEKLHTSARLATMGEIASMLAHELNQPLAAISSYTTGAINLLDANTASSTSPANAIASNTANDEIRIAIQKANAQAQRAGKIIRSVHEFIKKREAKREATDVNQLIANILPLVELQARAHLVAVLTQLAPNLPDVLIDKILIEQVLLNLTRNGIEAMAETSGLQRQLKITSALMNNVNNVELAAGAQRQLLIQVIDRGHGIGADIAQQLFTPFFSTKSTGMGMGLNICRTAIEFHGGSLTFNNHPEGGTTFSFTLPLAAPQPEAPLGEHDVARS
jgi:two-component system, LuxR family, sensor histidine kinase DctS